MAIKVIAFDADDTLWVNEPYFREAEEHFFALMEDFLPVHTSARELFAVEMQNLPLYGYGIKGFMLSMIETALKVSNGNISTEVFGKILELGKDMLQRPIELLDGIEPVLTHLKSKYRLVVATKGDLLDQERKLRKSGIEHYFHHIEIMSGKEKSDYLKLIRHLDISPAEFLMVGNSVKSDVLPVLEAGAHSCHIPFHITWAHEHVEETIDHENYRQLENARELLKIL